MCTTESARTKITTAQLVSVCIVHAGGRKAKLTKGAWNLYCEWPQLLILN